jgi:nitroimidazol reductase NimA-like FMN-containing flavoprotein (pyridoxamine 5'-phosphate oxidase superfamily)
MKTVIEMARAVGLVADANSSGFDSVVAFAELVRAEEREKWAKVCDELAEACEREREFAKQAGVETCADAIRAGGNT